MIYLRDPAVPAERGQARSYVQMQGGRSGRGQILGLVGAAHIHSRQVYPKVLRREVRHRGMPLASARISA